jgi:hypothetical protein
MPGFGYTCCLTTPWRVFGHCRQSAFPGKSAIGAPGQYVRPRIRDADFTQGFAMLAPSDIR